MPVIDCMLRLFTRDAVVCTALDDAWPRNWRKGARPHRKEQKTTMTTSLLSEPKSSVIIPTRRRKASRAGGTAPSLQDPVALPLENISS